jgi:DNA (cytosine-5)-methyltransferase 1
MGLYRAGYDLVGIDNRPQPRYPFAFIQGDALRPPVRLEDFDLIWASPPCQAFTQMSARWRGKGGKADSHEDLLTPTRGWLLGQSVPYVIENVPGAKRHMVPCLRLHGGMFSLGVNRPRLFESSHLLMGLQAKRVPFPIGVYGVPDGRTTYRYRNNGNMKGRSLIRAAKSLKEGSEAMGIDWMEWDELKESIPPAYSEFIGRQLIHATRNSA